MAQNKEKHFYPLVPPQKKNFENFQKKFFKNLLGFKFSHVSGNSKNSKKLGKFSKKKFQIVSF